MTTRPPATTRTGSSASTTTAARSRAPFPRTSTPGSKESLTARSGRMPKGTTTFEQRMADALVGGHVATDAAEGPPSKRTTVVVHADLTYLAGGDGTAELDVLGPLAPEVVRRLACDAKIVLSADNEKGHSIQQGEQRRGTPVRHSGSRSGAGTKAAAFPGARTRSSPTSTTSCTGSTVVPRPFPTS